MFLKYKSLLDISIDATPDNDDPALYNNITRCLHTFNCQAVIWGGDFNFVFNLTTDEHGGEASTNFRAEDECRLTIVECNLIDIWREVNPVTKAFSWYSNIAGFHCRIDFYLIAKVTNIEFQPPIQSDHFVVIL